MSLATSRAVKVTAGVVAALGIFVIYKAWANIENNRLKQHIEAKFSALPFLPIGAFIYQEITVNRSCTQAKLTRLYTSDMSPKEICQTVLGSLQKEGWSSLYGCRVLTYPFKRAPIDGDRPSYDFVMLDAKGSSHLGLNAQPKESWWPPQFPLTTHGAERAIPVAKNAGKTFFTVEFNDTQDWAEFSNRCNEYTGECECATPTLHAWKFANDVENVQSH